MSKAISIFFKVLSFVLGTRKKMREKVQLPFLLYSKLSLLNDRYWTSFLNLLFALDKTKGLFINYVTHLGEGGVGLGIRA